MKHAHATPGRRIVRPGDFFAIDQAWASYALHQAEPGAFFWLFAPPTLENERCGQIEVVRINGPLEYHDDGCGDSYELIVDRLDRAFKGEDENREGPPKAVVLRIDSPGGVVAGLSQTVAKIREMRTAAGIPLVAYADETAYSAAFALSCAADRRYLPRSGMVGSIGVISTMVDQTAADKKFGLKFAVIASGNEKADGHPHVPITDAMIDRERPRVETLAMQFYKDVKRATGLPIKAIQGFQARRFLGAEATRAKVADGLLSWDELLETLSANTVRGQYRPPNSAQTQTKPLAQKSSLGNVSKERPPMELTLDALITRTVAAIAAEKDPQKIATLGAELEAYKKTKHSIEKHETEEGDEDEEDEEDDEAAEEEGAKGDETDRGDDEEDDEDEDEDEDDDEDDSKKSKDERKGKRAALIAKYLGKGKIDQAKATALAGKKLETVKAELGIKPRTPGAFAPAPVTRTVAGATVAASADAAIAAIARELTGQKDAANVVAALRGHMAGSNELKSRLAAVEKRDRKSDRDTAVASALSDRRITPAEAKTLKVKKLAFVQQYLEMRPKGSAPVVAETSAPPGSGSPPGTVETFAGLGTPFQPGAMSASDPIAHAIMSAKAVGVTVTREQVIAGMAALNGKRATPEV